MKRALGLLAILVLVPGALAHAVPAESEPAAGARLDEAPQHIRVAFTEPVYEDGSWIQVRNAANERVDLDDLHIESGPRPVMTIGVQDLEDGAYRILWQTYSRTDGHTVGGAIGFAVGGFAPPDTEASETASVTFGSVAARTLQYAGYALAFGALAYHFFVTRQPRRRPERKTWDALLGGSALLFAGVLVLILDTAAQTGLGVRAYTAGEGGAVLLRRAVLAAGVLALTALWMWRGARRSHVGILAAAWVFLAWTGASLGHANVRGAWALPVQTIHAISVSAWVGGLAFLFRDLGRRDRDTAWTSGRRYGDLFLWSVVLLAVTGVVLSLAILAGDAWPPGGWITSPWGAFLVAKIAVALAMVALAVVNRYVFLADATDAGATGRLQRVVGRLTGWRPLTAEGRVLDMRRLVRTEATLGAGVLLLAAFLMSTAAPQAGLAVEDAAFETGAQGHTFVAAVQMDPFPTSGASHVLRAYVSDAVTTEPVRNHTCGRDDCLRLHWWPTAQGEAAGESVAMAPEGDGWWRVEDLLLASTGDHTFGLRVQTGDVFLDTLTWNATVLQQSR